MRSTLIALAFTAMLAGCATTTNPASQLTGATETRRIADNGDIIDEYRVAGQLRLIKVTPVRGPAYWIKDENGDGTLDRRDGVAPVYWKLFGW